MIALGDKTDFQIRLAEAIAWCNPRASSHDPKNCLRNGSWLPSYFSEDRINLVNSVVAARRYCLPEQQITPVRFTDDLKGGKLLVYFPDAELSDGAAEVASRGFFDVHNAPAWDTWVGLFEDDVRGPDLSYKTYLISYVPEPLVKLVNDGVEVNPEECIMWLENSTTSLRRHFKDLGLI